MDDRGAGWPSGAWFSAPGPDRKLANGFNSYSGRCARPCIGNTVQANCPGAWQAEPVAHKVTSYLKV